MATMKPYGGTSLNRLVEMINKDNNTSLEYVTDFTFETLYPKNTPGGRNTAIKLVPADPRFRTTEMRYRRLSLEVLRYLPAEFIKKVPIASLPFKIHDILDDINIALGLDLLPEEVLNKEYNTPQLRYDLTIVGPTASHAWLESTYAFEVDAPFLDLRVSEDGSIRILEDGTPRMLETA